MALMIALYSNFRDDLSVLTLTPILTTGPHVPSIRLNEIDRSPLPDPPGLKEQKMR